MDTKAIIKKSYQIVSSLTKQEPVRKRLSVLESELPAVYQHCQRVAVLSTAVGYKQGLTKSAVRMLACAGLLHDLGKLDIDTEILKKSGSLSAQEKQKVKKHSRLSFKRLDADFFQEIKKIVVAHHEHQPDPYPRKNDRKQEYDGLSQIVGAADMFDALKASRSYKDKKSENEIEEIMREEFTGKEELIDQTVQLGFTLKEY
jgi:HD-GYP domain-containing protein (c-di-GMP phosphodiesterase class II)